MTIPGFLSLDIILTPILKYFVLKPLINCSHHILKKKIAHLPALAYIYIYI